jgi:hypothetical protein
VIKEGFDVVLQGGKGIVLSTGRFMDCSDQHLLDLAFRHRSCITEKTGISQPADAVPNNRLFPPVVSKKMPTCLTIINLQI